MVRRDLKPGPDGEAHHPNDRILESDPVHIVVATAIARESAAVSSEIRRSVQAGAAVSAGLVMLNNTGRISGHDLLATKTAYRPPARRDRRCRHLLGCAGRIARRSPRRSLRDVS